MNRHWSVIFTITAIAGLLSGCSLKYSIDEPKVSHFTYQNVDKKLMVLKLVDQREDMKFPVGINGLSRLDLILVNIEEPVSWLAKGMEKEFVARGVPMKVVGGETAAADLTLTIKKYQVVNSRTSGFSPWESYHLFFGKVVMGDKVCTIPAYFSSAKVPFWSMDEIRDPCLNIPMSILVKEIVSKINSCAFNYSASDEEVNKVLELAEIKTPTGTEYSCLPTIELGGTNNPVAMKSLQKIAENEDLFIKTCAVSAMGTLGAQGQFDYLIKMFTGFPDIIKAIPLKSIGDINTPAALDFLRKVKSEKLYADENSVKYGADLYLDR